LDKHTSYLKSIRIGHSNWLHHREEFQLTFEFCKHLIDKLSSLETLELYNVHDCYDELQAYLTEHKPKGLMTTKLHNEDPLAEEF